MVGSRTATALAGLGVSLAITALAWYYFGTAMVFLFVPFVPFLFWRRGEEREAVAFRSCPACGFRTRDPSYAYCPRDGEPLE